MNTTDQAYLKMAHISEVNCEKVQTYYKNCLRLARYNKQDEQSYKRMLAILKKVKDKHKTQYNLI